MRGWSSRSELPGRSLLSPLLAFLVASACLVCRSSASSSGTDPTPVSSLTLSSPSLHGNRSSDREALLAFRSAVASDPTGALAPWNDRRLYFCRWPGVTCGGRRHPDRVTGLVLPFLGLSGPIPTSVTNLTFLRRLDLSENSFHGRIPEEFGRLPRLRVLNLEFNSLEGEIPASLGRCTQLQHVTLRQNSLSGALPPSLSNLSSLRSLDLSTNRLRGSIPPQLGGIATLVLLNLMDNNLTGSIPASFGNLTRLDSLLLSRNSLTGTIPPTIGKLQNLGFLYLSNNLLSGQIPTSIFNLTRMHHFSVCRNQLKGPLSPSFGKLQSLQILDLSANKFSGTIPKELFNTSISTLTSLDISENELHCEIPSSMGKCRLLVYVDVHGNNLQGKIPQSFNWLGRLEVLDVSMNNLSGNIPGFLQEFRYLNYLNLSFNDFDGEAPNGGIFQNAGVVSLLGNPKLRGGNSSQCLHQLYPCSGGEMSKGPLRRALLTAAAITLPAVVIIILCVIIFSRRSKRRSSPPMVRPKEMLPRVTYYELFKATEGFSPCNLIGAGSFGSVYEGKLDPVTDDPTFRRSVAVKVINLRQQHGASKSFMRECEALRSIRHRNIVKILTSCSSVDFHGNDFKALVFEFMPNGSLEQWLHPREINDYYCTERQLSLTQRLNIAVDVALAISYLHSHNSRPIVHRDLKPSNVLLDDEMVAHVSDFGLARFLPNRDGNLTSSSLAFKGSIGYVAPEYGMGCKDSTEGDVYSYGILLMEMVTGRRPTNVMFVGDLTLRRYVQMAFPDRVLDVVDSSLVLREGTDQNINNAVHVGLQMPYIHGTSISPESMNDYLIKEEARLACLASMLRLGLTCSKDSPKERTQMEAVVKEMTAVRERFLASF